MDDAILGVGIVLLISQAFAMIFSCVLTRAFRERGERMQSYDITNSDMFRAQLLQLMAEHGQDEPSVP